ncbi:MAG: hypothetical protein Q4F09_07280 [Erysipelotrichaceae bacterium]|nr:hypothetical protein [Erysipelotrichaceae bacterium]
MKFFQGLRYLLCVVITYLCLFLIEFLIGTVFREDLAQLHFWPVFFVMLALLILINPLITYFICERFPFFPIGIVDQSAIDEKEEAAR